MTQDHLNFIFIGISFAIYIGIAIRSRAGSTKEYYTAGGGVSPLANGMATAADWMSAATFISMAGTVALSGYDASRFLMGWTGGFVLLTILMVPYLRRRSLLLEVGAWRCSGLRDLHLHDLYHGSNAWSGCGFFAALWH